MNQPTPKTPSSRRHLLKKFGWLAAFIPFMGKAAVVKANLPKKADSPVSPSAHPYLLTEDGRLVCVDPAHFGEIRQSATHDEIQNWIKK